MVAELRAVLVDTDPRWTEVLNLLEAEDMALLVVADFCAVEPGNPAALTLADMEDGTWLDKYKQAAKQAAFYRLCQDA